MKENYIKFENQFRGSRESILERLDQYKEVLTYVKEEYPNSKTLDLGCGRGEWLEKCKQYELSAQGIDASISMIKYCKNEGLNACKGNIFKIMPHLKSDSYSLITAFHIIEHLENAKIAKLLIEAKRLLKENGILIIEMPSIDNIYVSTESFYLDETHINKIHPQLLIYKLGLHGFRSSELNYINGEAVEEQTHLMKQLFYKVGQDVTIVASKQTNLPKIKSGKPITYSIIKYPEKRAIITEIDINFEKNIRLLHQVSQQIKEESERREAQLKLQADHLQNRINEQADHLQNRINEQADLLQNKINEQADLLQNKINEQADLLQNKINEQEDHLQCKINELIIKLESTENELREKIKTIEKNTILRIENKIKNVTRTNLKKVKDIPCNIKAKIPVKIKTSTKSMLKSISLKIYKTTVFSNWITAARQRRIIKGLRLLGLDWIAQTIAQAIYEYKQKEIITSIKAVHDIDNSRSTNLLLLKRSNTSKRCNEIKRDLKKGGFNK
jgi:2-polyprenyl-3-methyl-5-hydroxy-6-metoxy-1,4-benzoquinol methylase